MRDNGAENNKTLVIVFAAVGLVAVIWLSVLIAPAIGGGLVDMLPKLGDVMKHPFRLTWCDKTLPCVAILSGIYLFILIVYHYTKPNYRRREEHGSAKWGDKSEIDKKYRQTPPESNKILSQNLAIGYDAHKHRRNLNTLVVGGSGAGKTRFYCKPNLMQCNTSFVILDPKGGATRS